MHHGAYIVLMTTQRAFSVHPIVTAVVSVLFCEGHNRSCTRVATNGLTAGRRIEGEGEKRTRSGQEPQKEVEQERFTRAERAHNGHDSDRHPLWSL
jgi:hypothetical protein